MLHFERSKDYDLIRAIIVQPTNYPYLSDDFSVPPDQYRPVESECVYYLVVWDDNTLLGLWMLHPHNAICWEVHTALLPHAWGERGHRAVRMMFEWVWTNTPCRRIVTNVPQHNRLAYRFALAAGMEVYGTNPGSFQKDGKLLDQICLGISRPKEMPLFDAGKRSEAPAVPEKEETSCR